MEHTRNLAPDGATAWAGGSAPARPRVGALGGLGPSGQVATNPGPSRADRSATVVAPAAAPAKNGLSERLGRLRTDSRDVSGPASSWNWEEQSPLEPLRKGEVIEGHRVLDELGRGAASIIYLAQDEKSKQIYALKHVKRETTKDQRFLEQAEYEYKVASKLDHPNIRKIRRMMKRKHLLKVKDLFLVMELVDGLAMDENPPKTFDDALSVFHQVALALGHMHERGFVHADMKPNNVVVSPDGTVKIIDLGQSCATGTVKPRIQGTPDFIAPEQVHRRAITPKTDIYNLGATMYAVLTDKRVPTALANDDSLLGSLDDSMIEKPTPAMELNERVHPKLNDVIMQCVEVDPAKRPESMAYVADRLNLVLG